MNVKAMILIRKEVERKGIIVNDVKIVQLASIIDEYYEYLTLTDNIKYYLTKRVYQYAGNKDKRSEISELFDTAVLIFRGKIFQDETIKNFILEILMEREEVPEIRKYLETRKPKRRYSVRKIVFAAIFVIALITACTVCVLDVQAKNEIRNNYELVNVEYYVSSGDTVCDIVDSMWDDVEFYYGVKDEFIYQIRLASDLRNVDMIKAGQTLQIPIPQPIN